MSNKKIKFNVPNYTSSELQSVEEYLTGGRNCLKDSIENIKMKTKAGVVLLTSGATSAMDLYFQGANLPKGSEVIMPSFTFPSAANCILRAGLKPVFAEIDKKTLVLDMRDVIEKITKKTSCIMPVHYGGISMDMDNLLELANKKKISIFEDAALSYDGYYKNRHLGTIGDAGVISFHSTKNISGDGGGALLINDSEKEEMYSEILANGTDKPSFLKGASEEYTWQKTGAGAEMSGLTAALLFAQLNKADQILQKRKSLWNRYFSNLQNVILKELALLPDVPEFNENNYHVFYIMFNSNRQRENVRKTLLELGIEAYIHYKPLHSSNMGCSMGYKSSDLPVTNSVSECLLRLPMHMSLSLNDVDYVCEAVTEAIADD